jgi:hypothetical protein
MKSDQIDGRSLFVPVSIIPYTLHPILPSSSCICIIAVRLYGSSGLQFCSTKSISSAQCVRSVYKAWSCMLDVWSLLPFGSRRNTTMKVVFCITGRLPVAVLPAHSPKSVASCFLPHVPFFIASRTSLAQFFTNIFTHYHRIHSALSEFSNGCQVSNAAKKSVSAVSQCRGLSHNCFRWFGPQIIDQCSFSRNPATHTFFHLLNAQKLGCPILLANCFKLIGALLSVLLKSNELSLS